MTKWSDFKVVRYDDSFMDKGTIAKANSFKKKGKLYAMRGFLLFDMGKSIKVVGEHDTFNNPTTSFRTKDVNKVIDRLSGFNGGQLVDVKMFEGTVAHKIRQLKEVC